MGDVRFARHLERLAHAADPAEAVRALADEDVVAALAGASRAHDPFLANVLATEAQNRMRRSRAVAEHMAEGALALGPDGRVRYANPAAEALLGWPHGALAGVPVDAVLPAALVASTLKRGEVRVLEEAPARRRDGRSIPVSVTVSPLRDDGEVEGAVVVFRDVSDRLRLEAERAQSREMYRAIFRSVRDGVLIADTDRRVQDCNPAVAEMLGWSREEIRGKVTREFYARAEDFEEMSRRLGRADHAPVAIAVPWRRRDGSEFYADISASWLRGPDGAVQGYVAVVRDVTERASHEATLRESEERYRLLVESVEEYAIILLDADGRVATWNPGAERIKGWTADEVVGRHVSLFYTPEDRDAGLPARLLGEAAGRGRAEYQGWRVRKDGSRFWADVVLTAVKDPDGGLRGFVKVTRDLTERHAREEEIRQLRADAEARADQQAGVAALGLAALRGVELHDLMVEAVRVVSARLGVEYAKILRLHPDGRALRLEAGVGWKAGLVGRADVPADLDSQAGYTLATEGPVVVTDLPRETRFRGPPLLHEHGVVSGLSVVIEDGEGRPWGVFGAHTRVRRDFARHDVDFLQAVANVVGQTIRRARTERTLRQTASALEEQVRERTRELEESVRELEAFSYTVSHDLRAPLRGIDFLSRTLSEDAADRLGPDEREVLARLRRESDRLARLVDDLLRLSRAARATPRLETVDVTALAAEVVAGLRFASDREVDVRVEPGLRARADPRLLRTVLENLLGNAWKYTRDADAPLVEVGTLAGDGRRTVFFVRDNGAGFDPAEAHRLFRPFERLHAPTEFEGSGIGLATVKRIVDRHGGRAWAEGAPGRGATFYFTLETPADAA